MVKIVAGIGKIVEGINAVTGALNSGRVEKIIYLTGNIESVKLRNLLDLATIQKITLEEISSKSKWSYHSRHSVVAICKPKAIFDESDLSKFSNLNIIVLDHIQDTNNFGAIIRSASAFDFNLVCIPKKRSVNITERTFSIASGGLESVNILYYNSIFSLIKKLKSNDYWTLGLDMKSDQEISKVNLDSQKVALFIGSEETGLSNEIKQKLDVILFINMANQMESLNASVASAIAMHHFFKKT